MTREPRSERHAAAVARARAERAGQDPPRQPARARRPSAYVPRPEVSESAALGATRHADPAAALFAARAAWLHLEAAGLLCDTARRTLAADWVAACHAAHRAGLARLSRQPWPPDPSEMPGVSGWRDQA